MEKRPVLSTPAEAASVILLRGSEPAEIYVVRRAPSLRFFGGFYAFPGGSVINSDRSLAKRFSVAARQVGAVRELFEETGVLLARTTAGSHAAPAPDWAQWRDDLINDRADFGSFLETYGLHLEPHLETRSLVVAYCLGLLLTFISENTLPTGPSCFELSKAISG